MLTGLSVRDVVLIEALDLEFGAGLGVLTGETGAGKSILLDALGLALGARADSALVRSGQTQATVTATFELPHDHETRAVLAGNGWQAKRANLWSSGGWCAPMAAAGHS
jgi:DNA repair protein RecN (Recombination protein N)